MSKAQLDESELTGLSVARWGDSGGGCKGSRSVAYLVVARIKKATWKHYKAQEAKMENPRDEGPEQALNEGLTRV